MERERLAPLVVALLATLALAAGAATLDSTTGSPGAGDVPGAGGEGDIPGPPEPPGITAVADVPPWVPLVVLAVLFALGLAALVRWIRDEGFDAVKQVALVVFLATGVLVFVHYLFSLFERQVTSPEQPEGRPGPPRTPEPIGAGGEVSQVVADPSAVVVAVLAVVVLGAVAVVVRTGTAGVDDTPVPEPEADAPDPSVREVGAAAGRAADRIDASGDVENAVYRAWREMTDPLDLPRETTTPGEFAAAAVDAGMAREDVAELTRLFEATRYGGVAVDEDRERRALAALRRVERTYGEGR